MLVRRVQLQKELTFVLVTLGKLEALSGASSSKKDDAPKSELQKVIADAVSIFKVSDNDYPALPEPVGWTMDPNKKGSL